MALEQQSGGARQAQERCFALVAVGSFPSMPCSRPGRIVEDGHGWCAQHAPSRVRARREAAQAAERAKDDAVRAKDEARSLRKAQERRLIDAALAWAKARQAVVEKPQLRSYPTLRQAFFDANRALSDAAAPLLAAQEGV